MLFFYMLHNNMKNTLKAVLAIFLVIIALLIAHYFKYTKVDNKYVIEQQTIDNIGKRGLYNILNPLVISFIEDNTMKYNIEKYRLTTPISFNKTFFTMPTFIDKYMSSTTEMVLLRAKKTVNINLVSPMYKHLFTRERTLNKNSWSMNTFLLGKDAYSKTQTIDIVLREHNILYIPRFWLFNFDKTDDEVEFFQCDNIFSRLFNYFIN